MAKCTCGEMVGSNPLCALHGIKKSNSTYAETQVESRGVSHFDPIPDSVTLVREEYHKNHYKVGEKDLYAQFIESFGLEVWLRHVEMEGIQYLWRARSKGLYREDIQKVIGICQRILVELEREYNQVQSSEPLVQSKQGVRM